MFRRRDAARGAAKRTAPYRRRGRVGGGAVGEAQLGGTACPRRGGTSQVNRCMCSSTRSFAWAILIDGNVRHRKLRAGRPEIAGEMAPELLFLGQCQVESKLFLTPDSCTTGTLACGGLPNRRKCS